MTGKIGREGGRNQFMIEEIQGHKTPVSPNERLEDSEAGG